LAEYYLVDYHVHSLSHGERQGTLDEVARFISTARARGIRELGFADHDRYYSRVNPAVYRRAAEDFPDVSVKMGMEAEFFPDRTDYTRDLLRRFDLDYIIGSVHYIGAWPFDNSAYVDEYSRWDISELYETYYNLVSKAVLSGLFDIIGHLDLIKVFGYRPPGDPSTYAESALWAIKKAGCAVEINTNGLYKPVGEIYPSPDIIRKCFNYNIPVTLSSDAHAPEDAGRDVDLAAKLARKAGYTAIATFTRRKMVTVPL